MHAYGSVPRTVKLIAAAGDAIVILTFAAIGRSSHGATDNGAVLGTLGTAAPFLVGWFAAALAGGAYRDDAFRSQQAGAIYTARSWLGGVLVGCGTRSAMERHLTPISFVAIAVSFNLILLTGWRTMLVAILTRLEHQPEH